jgi:hypothetical protein
MTQEPAAGASLQVAQAMKDGYGESALSPGWSTRARRTAPPPSRAPPPLQMSAASTPWACTATSVSWRTSTPAR